MKLRSFIKKLGGASLLACCPFKLPSPAETQEQRLGRYIKKLLGPNSERVVSNTHFTFYPWPDGTFRMVEFDKNGFGSFLDSDGMITVKRD